MKTRQSSGIFNVRIVASIVILAGAVMFGNNITEVNSGPSMLRTVGADINACTRGSISTGSGRLGCGNIAGARTSGSATIVSVDR